MFWGVTLENDKRYTQTVEASFHLSMAALDPNPPTNVDISKTSTVSLWLQHDKAEFLLCTLEYGKLYQQPLDCNFTEGEEVTFFVNGQGVIHLTGYLIEDMSMADESMADPMISSSEDEEEEEEDDDSEESDIPVLVDAKEFAKGAKKRTKEIKRGSKKKRKVEGAEKDSDESSSDYSETGDDEDDDDDEEEDDSSEEDFTEDSDDSDTDKITSKKVLKSKSENGKNNSNSFKQKQTKVTKEQKLSKKLKNKEKKNTATSMPSAEDEDCIDKSLLDASLTSEKKKKKKKKKAVKISGASNSSTPNNKQALSTSSGDPKSNSRVLASGLVVEDTQLGQGTEARIGRQVHVYYSGKLAKNGKMFDHCISGKPFRFALGRGEVIPGWDKGLVGMRVGGKRKLTIPAKLGYGSQHAGPIPPNSSLIFDIELKAVS